jgi:hypothetical protein
MFNARGVHIGEFDPITGTQTKPANPTFRWSPEMAMVYRLVSYDKETERKTGEFSIPDKNLAVVREIAGILPTDDGLGDYPLDDDQAIGIARLLNMRIDCDAFTYNVEPYEMPVAKNRA